MTAEALPKTKEKSVPNEQAVTVELDRLTSMTDTDIQERGIRYTNLMENVPLTPRQRERVDRLLTHVCFELTMRQHEVEDLEAKLEGGE